MEAQEFVKYLRDNLRRLDGFAHGLDGGEETSFRQKYLFARVAGVRGDINKTFGKELQSEGDE